MLSRAFSSTHSGGYTFYAWTLVAISSVSSPPNCPGTLRFERRQVWVPGSLFITVSLFCINLGRALQILENPSTANWSRLLFHEKISDPQIAATDKDRHISTLDTYSFVLVELTLFGYLHPWTGTHLLTVSSQNSSSPSNPDSRTAVRKNTLNSAGRNSVASARLV